MPLQSTGLADLFSTFGGGARKSARDDRSKVLNENQLTLDQIFKARADTKKTGLESDVLGHQVTGLEGRPASIGNYLADPSQANLAALMSSLLAAGAGNANAQSQGFGNIINSDLQRQFIQGAVGPATSGRIASALGFDPQVKLGTQGQVFNPHRPDVPVNEGTGLAQSFIDKNQAASRASDATATQRLSPGGGGTNSQKKYLEMLSLGVPEPVAKGIAFGTFRVIQGEFGLTKAIVDLATGKSIGTLDDNGQFIPNPGFVNPQQGGGAGLPPLPPGFVIQGQ